MKDFFAKEEVANLALSVGFETRTLVYQLLKDSQEKFKRVNVPRVFLSVLLYCILEYIILSVGFETRTFVYRSTVKKN